MCGECFFSPQFFFEHCEHYICFVWLNHGASSQIQRVCVVVTGFRRQLPIMELKPFGYQEASHTYHGIHPRKLTAGYPK